MILTHSRVDFQQIGPRAGLSIFRSAVTFQSTFDHCPFRAKSLNQCKFTKKSLQDHSRPRPDHPDQGPTGTRYPPRTRSFFQYPIRTRFVFKIIGYFGYRVFQKTMFFKWKTALGSYKILTNIFLYHLHLTKLDWLLPQCIVG